MPNVSRLLVELIRPVAVSPLNVEAPVTVRVLLSAVAPVTVSVPLIVWFCPKAEPTTAKASNTKARGTTW